MKNNRDVFSILLPAFGAICFLVLSIVLRKAVLFLLGMICFLLSIFQSIQLYQKMKRMIELMQRNVHKQPNVSEQSLQAKLAAKRLQLRLLQNQINPHFLYNTLDCIRGQAMICEQKEIAQIIECLSRYFRYCISRNEQLVTIEQELRNVQDYYYIQHYRFGDRIALQLQIEDESLLRYYVPKTILQPLVENAILHGLKSVVDRGCIMLSISSTADRIYISISDNGVGMSVDMVEQLNQQMQTPEKFTIQEENNRHVSFGLLNVNERLRLCFGPENGLRFHSVEGAGTDVQLSFPKVDDTQHVRMDSSLKEDMNFSL